MARQLNDVAGKVTTDYPAQMYRCTITVYFTHHCNNHCLQLCVQDAGSESSSVMNLCSNLYNLCNNNNNNPICNGFLSPVRSRRV